VVKLADIRPGMVLAQDARDDNGRLLLRQGQAVSEHALRIFRMWGVDELDVEGTEPSSAEPAVDPAVETTILAQARAQSEELFRHTNRRHPMITELHRLSSERMARKLGKASRRDP
jgi:hypothetical protein